MKRIGVRELRQNASRSLDLVKTGETVEVTEHGRLIALLAPPGDDRSRRDALIRSGRIVPGSGRLVFPVPIRATETVAQILDDLRQDRPRLVRAAQARHRRAGDPGAAGLARPARRVPGEQ